MLYDPETRASLLVSLSDPASQEAWTEFATIYRPIIVRVAQARGLQHADADDLAQDVLSAVGRRVGSFQSTGTGSFRRWLYQITRNLVVNHLTRSKGPIGSGDSDVQQMLLQQPSPEGETATLFQLEVRRFEFQQAAEKLQAEFSESTWMAFWLTSVEQLSIDEAANRLSKSAGSIRVARCRVLARFRQHIHDSKQDNDT